MHASLIFFSETAYTLIDPSIRLTDPVLLTILQMVQLEQLATNLLILPANRTHFRAGVDDQEGARLIVRIQHLVSEVTGLLFKENIALTLNYQDTREEKFVDSMYG